MILPVYPQYILSQKIQRGSAALFPTDTLPALGSLPEYSLKIWKIKKRPITKPLILMGGNTDQLIKYVHSAALIDACKMADKHWPGQLTIVLPIIEKKFYKLNQGKKNIGMRVPDCIIARELLLETGPLATTSINISGNSPSINEIQASNTFPFLPLLGPVPWPKPSGKASTVIIWEKKSHWRLLRKGSVIPDILTK